MNKLIPTIGIEVHCELKTKNKAFSPTLNTFGEVANNHANEIDFGYPGALPTLNKDIIDIGIKCALALNCEITKNMHFDRKNYFYKDLPKGYQITQKRTPIGRGGYVEIEVNGISKKILIEEIHIEEDTAKSFHEKNQTLLDYNRAGIPLIEIVTKPVISNEIEAVLYLEKLREILLYSEISDVKIEEGSMRCDVNVSLKEENSDILGTKTEIKNIGSISNAGLAILYEISRQKELIESGVKIKEETRKYDEKTASTILMRTKESNSDYRYFPEPDIPPVVLDDEWILNIKNSMPMLPDQIRSVYKKMNINDVAINTLIQYKDINKFLKEMIELGYNPITSANLLTGDVLSYLNKHNININSSKLTINLLGGLVDKLYSGEISSKIGKIVLEDMFESGDDIDSIISKRGLIQISDKEKLRSIIIGLLNDEIKEEYNLNNERILKYMMGQIMKSTSGKANPEIANLVLIEELEK